MSVLSMPADAAAPSIVSARSIRTHRSRLATATAADLLRELAGDEAKYMRELRTLVDGVIPVLLRAVLSEADSAVAAGLFGRRPAPNPGRPGSSDSEKTAKGDSCLDESMSSISGPIVAMGIALERLKAAHEQIPTTDGSALLRWAQTTRRTYAEYVRAWRLGFQDVVVNLAPAADESRSQAAGWEGGLGRNADGDVVDGDGERVDVAFLLKRPLVRLKYLSKTLRVSG